MVANEDRVTDGRGHVEKHHLRSLESRLERQYKNRTGIDTTSLKATPRETSQRRPAIVVRIDIPACRRRDAMSIPWVRSLTWMP